MSKLEEQIFQAIGEASICWEIRPVGVFDSTRAKEVGDRLNALVKQAITAARVEGLMEAADIVEPNGQALYEWQHEMARLIRTRAQELEGK